MNTLLWILQIFIALTFLYSGICKVYFSEQKLVAMGQTGVEGLPLPFIRFIGIAEILGSIGLILPWLLSLYPVLTPVSALCLAVIMPFAARAHYMRNEYKQVAFNTALLCICIFIAVKRF
jgi:uncharacterized membrane protein YphA (DoxX/SURF4 family)